MTDEMMIEQKKPSALPYIGVGAAIGAGGGYAVNKYCMTKPMSHDDVIKEMNDKDKFEARTKEGAKEADVWKDAKTKQEAVETAKAELETAKKGKLADTAKEAIELKDAQAKYDAEFKRLVGIEKGKSGSVATSFPSRKVLEESLTSKEFKNFESYLNRYENARKRLLGKPGTGMTGSKVLAEYKAVGTARNSLKTVYENAFTIYDKLSDKNKAKFDPLKNPSTNLEINKLVDARLPKDGYGSYDYKQFVEMQEKFGSEVFNISETSVSGATKKVKNPATGKYVWVTVDKKALTAARENMRNEYASNFQKAIEFGEKAQGFDKEFFEANKDALKELRKPIKDAKNLKNLSLPKNYTQQLKVIEVLELSIKNGFDKYPVDLGSGYRFKNADELAIFKGQLQYEKELAIKYAQERSAIESELKGIINSDITVKTAKEKLQQKIANDPEIKRAIDDIEKLNGRFAKEEKKALYEKIKGMLDIKPGASEAEIEANVRKALEGGNLDNVLKDKQKLYDEALKKGGVVDDNLVKAAEEKLAKAETSFKEATEAVGKKFTKSGNKWLAMGVGALALGVTALAFRPKAKEA